MEYNSKEAVEKIKNAQIIDEDNIREEVEQTIDNYECQVKMEDVTIDLSFIDAEIGSEEVQLNPAENETKVEEMKPKLGRGMRKQFPTKL